ncbi:diacylglycerol acyltransferase type 2a [Apiospora arundinis]
MRATTLRTDSETTESPQQSSEAKARLSNEATSLQAARKSFEAAAEKAPKVTKLATKKSSSKPDRNEKPATTEEAPINESKRRIEQQSRLPRSPETTSTATFSERSKVDTPSRNPHSLDFSRQSKIPSPSAAPETRTHRRTPSSAASVASAVSDEPSSPATTVDTPSPKPGAWLRSGSNRKLFNKSSSEVITVMGEQGAPNGSKDESFVHASEAPEVIQLGEKEAEVTGEKQPEESHASSMSHTSENTLAEEHPTSTETSGGASYAEALKEGPNGHENGASPETEEAPGTHGINPNPQEQEAGSDDSYPDLDPLTIEERHTHEPVDPPQSSGGRIRWAPFNVPAERRLQTLTVLFHCTCIAVSVSVFFALCANPFVWPLLIIYLLHMLTSKAATDGSLKYRSEWFRSSYMWHLFAGYFPAKLHKTHNLAPTRKYIFGYHPHGIISHGAFAAFATDALDFSGKFPGITNTLLTLDNNFRIPLYRDYILAMGVRSVSKESIVNILTRGGSNKEGMGRAVTIVIGGARESLEAQPGQLRLILKERKGFIKIAIRTGADLVPVLAFGENELYHQLQPHEHPFVHRVQMFILKVWKFTLPFLHGRGIFNYDVGMMPYRHPLNIVVGAPVKVNQSNTVDDKEVDRLHELYVTELEKVWDKYKDEFSPDRKEDLQILS